MMPDNLAFGTSVVSNEPNIQIKGTDSKEKAHFEDWGDKVWHDVKDDSNLEK
jgi:hypothetical protein